MHDGVVGRLEDALVEHVAQVELQVAHVAYGCVGVFAVQPPAEVEATLGGRHASGLVGSCRWVVRPQCRQRGESHLGQYSRTSCARKVKKLTR
jgi:hypothetical protein